MNYFPKSVRFSQEREVTEVLQKGTWHSLGLLSAKCLPSSHRESRFLISVKKTVGSAVFRNRVKRLIREAIRLNRGNLSQPYDIFLMVRSKPKYPLTYPYVEQQILFLFSNLNASKSDPKCSSPASQERESLG